MGFGIKPAYNTEEPYQINLQKGRGKEYQHDRFNISAMSLPNKFMKPMTISPEQLADIRALLCYIPVTHHAYYNGIFSGQEDVQQLAAGEEEVEVDDLLNY